MGSSMGNRCCADKDGDVKPATSTYRTHVLHQPAPSEGAQDNNRLPRSQQQMQGYIRHAQQQTSQSNMGSCCSADQDSGEKPATSTNRAPVLHQPAPSEGAQDNNRLPIISAATDAVNPNKNAEQQGKARFKQVNCVHQQILMLAALALRLLGLPVAIRDIIFLHGGECFGLTQWTGVVAHFFELLVTRTDADIKEAARAWCIDPAKALVQYGHISCWEVSQVTDMSCLFHGQTEFNDSLYYWDVRNVVDMGCMFMDATSFDQNLSAWDIR